MEKKPNIIIFNPDQWRGDMLGYLGYPGAITPNLDNIIKKDAVAFKNAYCQATVCTPSRCSFMTGWYPHVHGHRTMHYMLHTDQGVSKYFPPYEFNILRFSESKSKKTVFTYTKLY